MYRPMYRRKFTLAIPFLIGLAAACGDRSKSDTTVAKPSAASASSALQIWWVSGYAPEERMAAQKIIDTWAKTKNIEINLSFFKEKDVVNFIEDGIKQGNKDLPDVAYSNLLDFTLIPRLAWEGRLADVSSVIKPIENLYSPEALASVFYLNKQENKRGYYAVPFFQETSHIHYWQDLLLEAGLDQGSIPTEWSAFWQFWQQAQDALKQKGNEKMYGLGLPMSIVSRDTFNVFQQFLEAYGVDIVDQNGQLLLDKPSDREAIINALDEYTSFYKKGYVPPDAIDWAEDGNNKSFLSRNVLMTVNLSMSIPSSQLQDKLTYSEKMRTLLWAKATNGKSMENFAAVKQAVVFAHSQKLKESFDLLSYLVQPENLNIYLEGAQGRYFPVMPKLLADPFWNNKADPHVSIATKQFQSTRPFYPVFNPAYIDVQAQNVWGVAIRSICKDDITPKNAADKAIEDIKNSFKNYV